MAECTQYSSLVVEDSSYTIQYGLNGTYVPNGTSVTGGETYTIFIKQGAVNYPRIWVNPIDPNNWRIDGTAPYPGFNFSAGLISTFGNCPVGVWTDQVSVTGIQASGSNSNTFGLPTDVVALITSRFGTVANFLRLRNQGQV